MNNEHKKILSVVRRYHAENYMLTSLIAFCVTVISLRVALQLTGFPQIGNNTLHIAHALWDFPRSATTLYTSPMRFGEDYCYL
jgi:hypothetical protein